MSSSTEPQNSLTTPSAPLALRLRPMVESDLPFLTSSWLKSYRDEQACANDIYHAGMSARIGRISEVATVIVACNPLRPGKIYGYIVYELPLVQSGFQCRNAERCIQRVGSLPCQARTG